MSVTVNSTDGDLVVGDLTALGNIAMSIVASDADESENNTLIIGEIEAEGVITLVFDSANDVTVDDSITSNAAENTGLVIDITLSGEGDVDLGVLEVEDTSNTTRINAADLEGALTVTLAGAQDRVILGSGSDVISLNSLEDSLFGSTVWIQNFSAANDTLIIGDLQVGGVTISGDDQGVAVVNLGTLTGTLTASLIKDAWDAAVANGDADADDVAYFRNAGREFLLVDDGEAVAATFVAADDAIIEITGLQIDLGAGLFFV